MGGGGDGGGGGEVSNRVAITELSMSCCISNQNGGYYTTECSLNVP